MLLRRFYIQENEKAPEPKPKKTRELKTEILPLDSTKIGLPIAVKPGETPGRAVPFSERTNEMN